MKSRRPVQNAEYQVMRPQEWITLSAPAIVSEDTWAEAQRRMAEDQKRLGGNPGTKYLLSPLDQPGADPVTTVPPEAPCGPARHMVRRAVPRGEEAR